MTYNGFILIDISSIAEDKRQKVKEGVDEQIESYLGEPGFSLIEGDSLSVAVDASRLENVDGDPTDLSNEEDVEDIIDDLSYNLHIKVDKGLEIQSVQEFSPDIVSEEFKEAMAADDFAEAVGNIPASESEMKQ